MTFLKATAAAGLAVLAATAPVLAGPNSLNSSVIPTQLGNIYTGISQSCGNCHGINSAARPNDPDGSGTAYGRDLDRALNLGSGTTESAYNGATTDAAIDAALRQIEAGYAPFISTAGGVAFSSTNTAIRTLSLPGTQTSLSVTVSPGRSFTGTTDTILAFNPESTDDLKISSSAGTTLNLDITTTRIPFRERGDRRRAGQPYDLDLNPKNTTGFFNSTATNLNRNRLRVTFNNIAPVGVADSAIATASNTAASPLALNVLANDSDADSDGTAMRAQIARALDAADGSVVPDATGRGFLYTLPDTLPATEQTVTFTYRPVDNDSPSTSLAGTETLVSIRIPARPAENPPTLVNDTFAATEDTVLNGDVSTNDSDPEGLDTLAYSVTTQPTAGQGSVAMNADGTFTYTPANNFNGAAGFSYTAFDGTFSRSANVTLNVAAVNDAPVAVADSAVASSGNTTASPLDINVLANDSDVDSTGLTVRLTADLPNAGDGTLALNAGGNGFRYTVPDPLPATAGSATFRYRAVDPGGAESNEVAVTVAIPSAAPVGGPPIARNDLFALTEDTPFTGDVKTNDADPDGLNTVTFSVSQAPPPQSGVLTFRADGTFDFNPAENFNGRVEFRYVAFDGSDSDDARVRLDVAAVNDAPVAQVDTAIATEANTNAAPLEIDVLANDTDVDSTGLTAELVEDLASAADGTVTLAPGGTGFRYAVPDPLPANSRVVRFRYRPRDSDGLAGNIARVNIRIPAASAPVTVIPVLAITRR
jgi:hypothetical protein